MSDRQHTYTDLLAIMHRLRSPGGCPWDAEQSHTSLRPYMIEEACEAIDAIQRGDDHELCDELGDVLLQVIFHAEMAAERGAFTMKDVVEGLARKLVRRHPHVFADATAKTPEQVVANWSEIKAQEKVERARAQGIDDKDTAPSSALDGIPRSLPALALADRIGRRAASAGFDWSRAEGARDKIHEELEEIAEAVTADNEPEIAREIGDMLLAASSYARLLNVNGEIALRDAVDRFEKRFRHVECDLRERNIDGQSADDQILAEAWQRAKDAES